MASARAIVSVETTALLERYNPVLVLYPQNARRAAPGAWRKRAGGRGDYHPCSAEFFLAGARVLRCRRPWQKRRVFPNLAQMVMAPLPAWLRRRAPFGRAPQHAPTPEPDLRALLAGALPAATESWDIDLVTPSQLPSIVWERYASLLPAGPFPSTAYGRCAERDGRRALQYWYLYFYNDAGNNHEGDWEMVTVEVDTAGQPLACGYATHEGGHRRAWENVPRDARGHPLVFVARGSHAAYCSFVRRGYWRLGARTHGPLIWRTIIGAPNWVAGLKWLRDFPPALPGDPCARPHEVGDLVCPRLCPLPADIPGVDDPDFWWMNLQGRWGSSHFRLRGAYGPEAPWGVGGNRGKWEDPIAWLDSLSPDPNVH